MREPGHETWYECADRKKWYKVGGVENRKLEKQIGIDVLHEAKRKEQSETKTSDSKKVK